MSTPAYFTAQNMADTLEEALLKNVGVTSITVDGQTINFANREAMIAEWRTWKREAARARGKRPLFRGVNLGTAW